MKAAIRVENLSKEYRLGERSHAGYRTIRESIGEAVRKLNPLASRPSNESRSSANRLLALNDVSFEVEPGEVLGVIGRNGSGKSTLLKILSKVTEPSSGRAVLCGRVGSLLEVGTGFHPELTGRENIYLNGSILGMKRSEINRKFDEIVAFSEIDRFLDTPVKRYSSGMYVRLAFAVAAHLEPEILVVDEVLAVGDQAFQVKCLGKLEEVAQCGRTVLLVSHNMASILCLCQKVLLLDQGRLEFSGDCEAGVTCYQENSRAVEGLECDLVHHPHRRPGSKPYLRSLHIKDGKGQPTDQIGCGDPIQIEVLIDLGTARSDYNVHLVFEDQMGIRLFTLANTYSSIGSLKLGGRCRALCTLDRLALCPGKYAVSVFLGPVYKPVIDAVDQALWFEVVAKDYFGNGRLPKPADGRLLVGSEWKSDVRIESV